MRILGIDPGFEKLGVAVLERAGGKDTLFYSECFRTSARLPFPERLNALGTRASTIIKKWKPRALAIETLYFEKNLKTAMRVAEARGVVIYEAARAGLSVYEYTPLQVKIAVTGWGRADKKSVMNMVSKLIQLKNKKYSDDELDAVAIGLTHLASAR